MKLLLSTFICVILILALHNQIRKYRFICYGGSLILAAIAVFLPAKSIPAFLIPFFTQYLGRGILATSLFVLVMYAAIIPKDTRLYKALMGTRRDTAIIASFLILVHNISFGRYFFIVLFTAPGHLQVYQRVAAGISCVMIMLLISLTYIINKNWDTIRNISYLKRRHKNEKKYFM